jgi:hypothetical protein
MTEERVANTADDDFGNGTIRTVPLKQCTECGSRMTKLIHEERHDDAVRSVRVCKFCTSQFHRTYDPGAKTLDELAREEQPWWVPVVGGGLIIIGTLYLIFIVGGV